MRRDIGTILVGLGAFFLTFAPLLKFYVAPRVVAVPTDFWQMTTLRDDHATYFDAAAQKSHIDTPVILVSTVRGDVRASKGNIAVWDYVTAVKPPAKDAQILTLLPVRYAFDRRTGGLTNCCAAAVNSDTSVKMSGLGLVWPVAAVEKKTYLYFDPGTLQAYPIRYEAVEYIRGIAAYRYTQTIPQTMTQPLGAIPAKIFGLDGKKGQLLSDKYIEETRTVWVDPRTGIPISQREQIRSVAKTRDGRGELVMADADLRMTAASQQQLAALSDSYAFTFGAVKDWGPAAALTLGMVLLLGGVLYPFIVRIDPPGRRRAAHVRGEQLPQPSLT